MLEINSFISKLSKVEDTIILYGSYSSATDKTLMNLHTFAMLMVDPSIDIKVITKKVKRVEHHSYEVSE